MTGPSKNKLPPAERHETDQSLQVERKKTDAEIGRRDAAIEARSDAVVEQARDRADQILEDARELADQGLRREHPTSGQLQAIEQERKAQDAVLVEERQSADDKLSGERDARVRALEQLLKLERQETDGRLLIERDRGDEALAARDDFMGMVSHDVRNLLGGIALSAEMQIEGATDDEAGRRNLKAAKRIQRFTAQITRLITDLMDVASIEAGRFSLRSRPHDVAEVVREAVETFQPLALAKSIVIKTRLPEQAIVVSFDHGRILQVLTNLLSNAIKFSGTGGSVAIDVMPAADGAQISVTDNGEGIDARHLGAVFDRYWQVAAGDRRGVGLGLFISRSVVEAHGGRIWAESELGKGSTFSVTLPQVPKAAEAPR